MSRKPRSSGRFSHFLFFFFSHLKQDRKGYHYYLLLCNLRVLIVEGSSLEPLQSIEVEKCSCFFSGVRRRCAFIAFLWTPSLFLTITSLSWGEGKYLFTNSSFFFLFLLLLYNVWEKEERGWAWMLHQHHQLQQREKEQNDCKHTFRQNVKERHERSYSLSNKSHSMHNNHQSRQLCLLLLSLEYERIDREDLYHKTKFRMRDARSDWNTKGLIYLVTTFLSLGWWQVFLYFIITFSFLCLGNEVYLIQ